VSEPRRLRDGVRLEEPEAEAEVGEGRPSSGSAEALVRLFAEGMIVYVEVAQQKWRQREEIGRVQKSG
jgi:hypothetical protein